MSINVTNKHLCKCLCILILDFKLTWMFRIYTTISRTGFVVLCHWLSALQWNQMLHCLANPQGKSDAV